MMTTVSRTAMRLITVVFPYWIGDYNNYHFISPDIMSYKAFRHVETLFVQGNIFVLNQNKPPCLVIKKEVNYC